MDVWRKYVGVFVIVASDDEAKVRDNITNRLQAENYYQLDNKTWFVSSPDGVVTPKDMSDYLTISGGAAGRVLVMNITTYYGYHRKDAWDWLTIKGV